MTKDLRKLPRTAVLGVATLAVGMSALTIPEARAGEYPERPVTLVIPYGPGGATDISGRTLAVPLAKIVPKPVLVVNRTGAGGATGTVTVRDAAADGYTMMVSRVGSHSVNPAMKATLPYKIEEFDQVGVYEINPVACAVKADSPIKSMEELVAKVKAAPKTISYSSSGVGSLLHIAGAMVIREFGIANPVEDVIHIPLKGGGAAATAVLAGTATFICTNSSALASFVANKQLRPLMVTTKEKVPGFDAPTAADLGKPALHQLVGWSGIAGPKGLPDGVKEKWRGWLKAATEDKGFLEKMGARGSVIQMMTPEDSNAFINNQYNVFKKLVDELGMRIEG